MCDQLCIIVNTPLFNGKFYFDVLAKYFEVSSVECAEQKLRQVKKSEDDVYVLPVICKKLNGNIILLRSYQFGM